MRAHGYTAGMLVFGLLGGCENAPQQDPGAVLVEWKSEHAIKGGTLEKRHQEIVVGSDPSVPVAVDWTAAVDTEGACRRVQNVTLTRKGGATDFVIYKAEVKRLEPSCVKDAAFGEPVERFSVELCYRWKGASNGDDCAYQTSFLLDGETTAIKRPPG